MYSTEKGNNILTEPDKSEDIGAQVVALINKYYEKKSNWT